MDQVKLAGMFYVYAVYNQKHDKIYIGQTDDLEQRIRLHNSKQFIRVVIQLDSMGNGR